MESVTKSSVEVVNVKVIAEAIANAFRIAIAPRRGAAFISLPQNILNELTSAEVIKPAAAVIYGRGEDLDIENIALMIQQAKRPVLLLGGDASLSQNAKAIRSLLSKVTLPTVSTFQSAGVVSRDLIDCFAGRVGLFRNQPGDHLLNKADLIITVGFNRVEYDPEVWHAENNSNIIHIDYNEAPLNSSYQPAIQLLGAIDKNIYALAEKLNVDDSKKYLKQVQPLHDELNQAIKGENRTQIAGLIHPLDFIHQLRNNIDDEATVICDVGSIYMWMARYFLSFRPHQLLFSNGQQTLGIALPWAMAANFANTSKQVISMSGDGGFLFSAMELETAVRNQHKFVHFVWRDGCYNMVMEQEKMKYKRRSGVDFGHVDLEHYANAFGAKGMVMESAQQIPEILQQAQTLKVPLLVDVPINYQDNPDLFKVSKPFEIN